MAFSRRGIIPLLIVALLLPLVTGCGSGSTTEDSAWRQEVNGSLQNFEGLRSLRYRIHLETWIGVSGQSVYGDERGDGSYLDGDFSVVIVRNSPAGEENLVLCSQEGEYFLREDDAWSIISSLQTPSPLYDPIRFVELLPSYDSVSFQGEEERSGVTCRRYLLRLGNDRAQAAISERAWSYFSSLQYELSCTVWVSSSSEPPCSLQLEIVGHDPQESLQRYRALVSMDLYDLDSPDIQLISPGS
jgi:hypothetical protein